MFGHKILISDYSTNWTLFSIKSFSCYFCCFDLDAIYAVCGMLQSDMRLTLWWLPFYYNESMFEHYMSLSLFFLFGQISFDIWHSVFVDHNVWLNKMLWRPHKFAIRFDTPIKIILKFAECVVTNQINNVDFRRYISTFSYRHWPPDPHIQLSIASIDFVAW